MEALVLAVRTIKMCLKNVNAESELFADCPTIGNVVSKLVQSIQDKCVTGESTLIHKTTRHRSADVGDGVALPAQQGRAQGNILRLYKTVFYLDWVLTRKAPGQDEDICQIADDVKRASVCLQHGSNKGRSTSKQAEVTSVGGQDKRLKRGRGGVPRCLVKHSNK